MVIYTVTRDGTLEHYTTQFEPKLVLGSVVRLKAVSSIRGRLVDPSSKWSKWRLIEVDEVCRPGSYKRETRYLIEEIK